MAGTSLAGVLVLRSAGRGRLASLRAAAQNPNRAASEADEVQAVADGFLSTIAGVLLVLPGFVTDVAGVALLLPGVRRWCGRTFLHAVRDRRPADPGVVDLAPEEWRPVSNERERSASDIDRRR
jgi:UPF0716 protein FxsA